MLRTTRAASLASAFVALALVFTLAGCNIQKNKDGEKESVKIETPLGGLNVNTEADAKDTGLAIYPGAKPGEKKGGEHNSANVNISSSLFGVKVVALEYTSDDSPEKVKEYYKKELGKFGPVLDCPNGVKDQGDDLKCSDTPKHDHKGNDLVVGTKQRQHIVSIEPKGSGTKFGLVYVQVRGKEGAL